MMKIAMLSPLSWRTPPRHYRSTEKVVSLLAEQLVLMGFEVTLFASGDSQTSGELVWVCERPYLEDPNIDPKVWECLHIAELFKHADEYDPIHNHNDFYLSVIVASQIHRFSPRSMEFLLPPNYPFIKNTITVLTTWL